jgi:hypothetical protein
MQVENHFETKYHTPNCTGFWNKDQTIKGEVRATHDPEFNSISYDDPKMKYLITWEMYYELQNLTFPDYHGYGAYKADNLMDKKRRCEMILDDFMYTLNEDTE